MKNKSSDDRSKCSTSETCEVHQPEVEAQSDLHGRRHSGTPILSNQETVQEYADLMLDGVEFPPVDVYQDKTGAYLMSDGFLRLQAAGFAHKEELACNSV